MNSSPPDSGKGKSKSSSKRISHGFQLVEGKSGHDMEDYHVAEYRKINNHELGLFAIFDGHLGDRVPSYLKDNLFINILQEVKGIAVDLLQFISVLFFVNCFPFNLSSQTSGMILLLPLRMHIETLTSLY